MSAAWWAPMRWWSPGSAGRLGWPNRTNRPNRPNGPALAGGLALASAALIAAVVTPRWQAERSQAEAQQALAARPAAALRPNGASAPDAAVRLWQALPPADQAPQRIAHLTGLARQHGVTIDGTRLGRIATPAGATLPAQPALARQPMVQPVTVQQLPLSMAAHGPYPAVRRFVAEALQHDDALLLDRLRLSRASPAAAEVAVDLQWALLQRAPAAAASTP